MLIGVSSAVLVVVRGESPQREVLLTKRASSLRHHAGEIAFPGGRVQPEDESLFATALREAREEVGLDSDVLSYVGELPVSFTRANQGVKPYVVTVPSDVSLAADSSEVERLFWCREQVLIDDKRERTDVFMINGQTYWSPAYRIEGELLWGFTARVLIQAAEQYLGLKFTRENSAPIFRYQVKPSGEA